MDNLIIKNDQNQEATINNILRQINDNVESIYYNENDETALHVAVNLFLITDISEELRLNIVKNLVQNGAKINARNKFKCTPLHYAACNGDLDIVHYFLDHGAQIEAKDDVERTPIVFAVYKNHFEIVKCLIEKGAQLDNNEYGYTALHIAAEYSSLEMVKLLVQNGAKIDKTTIKNHTPFEIADQNNRQDIALYLLQKKREAKNIIPKENFSNKEPCIICTEPRNELFVLIPCGHISLCEPCSYALMRQTNPKCPSCRASVQDYTKVFFQSSL